MIRAKYVTTILYACAIAVAALALLSFTSCASVADLRAYEDASSAALEEFRAGTITEEEYLERELALREEFTDATQEEVASWAARLQEGPITGQPIVDLIIGSIPTVLGGGYLLNRQRNNNRRKRGEKVKIPEE